jgi:hypothetical protein
VLPAFSQSIPKGSSPQEEPDINDAMPLPDQYSGHRRTLKVRYIDEQ